MSEYEFFDTVVIGTGQGGKPFAQASAAAGKRTAIIESGPIGGTCVNVGCTPTKAMVASARTAHTARSTDPYGVRVDGVKMDMERVRERKRSFVSRSSKGNRKGLEEAENLELVEGRAHFIGPREIAVDLGPRGERRLRADLVVINTGQLPAPPELPGLDDVDFLDSTSIMELAEVPAQLLVLGGGYIGVEFAQMFRRFGSEVTLVQRGSQLLPREDEEMATLLRDMLEEEGIEVLLDSDAKIVQRSDDRIRLEINLGGVTMHREGNQLLVATGRRANTADLQLDKAGVQQREDGSIVTDGHFATSAEGVYAIGDVRGGPAFTHISYDDYRILAANLLEGEQRSCEGRLVPYTVFSEPPLAHIGLHESELQAQGRDYRVATLAMSHVAYAWERGETTGRMKAMVDPDSGEILGFTMLGIEAGEVMTQVQLAMMGGLTWRDLRDTTFTHPSLGEGLNNIWGSLDRS